MTVNRPSSEAQCASRMLRMKGRLSSILLTSEENLGGRGRPRGRCAGRWRWDEEFDKAELSTDD